MSNSSIWPIDKTQSGATTPGHNGLGSDGNEGVLHISQSFSITGASPSDFLISLSGHSLRVQLVYFIAPADWAIDISDRAYVDLS